MKSREIEVKHLKKHEIKTLYPKIEVSCIVIHEKEENTLNRVIYSNSIINTPIIVKTSLFFGKTRYFT